MMDEQAASAVWSTNPRLLVGAAIILLAMMVIAFMAVTGEIGGANGLLPQLASATPLEEEGAAAPVPLTFSELNADPLTYLNKRIQVSGEFLPLNPPACDRYSGPQIRWALVAEDLQLDAQGYERIVRILEPGTEMTVQGVWRLYQGPLGCGKGPPRDSAWFLEVKRILQPNPLVGGGAGAGIEIENNQAGLPDLLPTAVATATPTATPTLAPTGTFTATPNQPVPTVTLDAAVTAAPSPTLAPTTTPPPTTTPAVGGATPGPTSTLSATATSASGAGAQPTNTPQLTIAPTSTQASGAYPGPATNTPTATVNPYP